MCVFESGCCVGVVRVESVSGRQYRCTLVCDLID